MARELFPPRQHKRHMPKNPKEATAIAREAEPELLKRDEPGEHQSLKHILSVKCWLHVWDNTLDRGYAGTVATQRMLHFLLSVTESA